jgi:hypothetical protein
MMSGRLNPQFIATQSGEKQPAADRQLERNRLGPGPAPPDNRRYDDDELGDVGPGDRIFASRGESNCR